MGREVHLRSFLAIGSLVVASLLPGAPPAQAEPVAEAETIGTITVHVRDIFDTSKPGEDKALYRLANRLHMDTHEEALRAQLLFAEGDVYRPRVLQETERALRKLRYIREPVVRAVSHHDGVVDIDVSALETWTMSPGVSYGRKGGANSTSIEFDDFNVFGTGKHLSLGLSQDVDRSSTIFAWSDPNVFGSRWTSDVAYADSDDGHTAQFEIERPFFSFDTRWTAGMRLLSDDGVQHRYALGERSDEFRREMRNVDLYFGTSRGWDDGWVRRFTMGLRHEDASFADATGYLPSALLPADRSCTYP
jgi:hypothetical protein